MDAHNKVISSTIDKCSDRESIANLFGNKYKLLYNSVKSSKVEIDKVKAALALKCMINETKTINVGLIAKCIKDLKGGKSDGSIGFSSEATGYMSICLLCFSQC